MTTVMAAQTRPYWNATESGYDLVGGPVPARVFKSDGAWWCDVAGVTHRLGKRANFFHADALVQEAAV